MKGEVWSVIQVPYVLTLRYQVPLASQLKGGLLDRDGRVHVGDRIVLVNGFVALRDKPVDEAARLIVS